MLELKQSASISFEFIEGVKSDLLQDKIYIFTLEGRLIGLPSGATPVDFAYALHTDIGHACIIARVDRQPHPLSQSLTSGQTIEVITAPGARLHTAWLAFIVSSKVRAKIKQILKTFKDNNSIKIWNDIFNHTLGSSRKLAEIPNNNIKTYLERIKLEKLDNFL